MHFDKGQIANTNHRIANFHKSFTEFVDVCLSCFLVHMNNHIFSAIAEFNIAKIIDVSDNVIKSLRLFFVLKSIFQIFFAHKETIKSCENDKNTTTARVNNACFFKNRKHFRSLFQNFFAGIKNFFKKNFKVVMFFCQIDRIFCHNTNNG